MMTEDQMKIKIAYLLEENKQLREQILDLQIRAGHISLKGEE